ncbi:MAG: hypothetical protein HY925_02650, partial [Elusimicrobia bacterium]|nr:hypothetical protein [Elusimicrobiota bacterium]
MLHRRLSAAFLALWLPLQGVASAQISAPRLSGGAVAGAFDAAAAAGALETFFTSPAPDLGLARGVSTSIRSLNTSDPAVLRQLEPVVRRLRASAAILASPRVSRDSTESSLAAAALKLQALNYPELRHLLEPQDQRAVGSAFWIYQTHLTKDVRIDDWAPSGLPLEKKIEGIARALEASAVAPAAGSVSRLASDAVVKVEVSGGDISKKKAAALLSAVQPSGFCEGGINRMLAAESPGWRAQVEAAMPLKDGRAFVARGDTANPGLFDHVVFVTDAMRLPLRQIVANALRAADDAGFKTVSLPALRSGWNFGFIERSYEEIVAETLRGVRLFEEEGRSSVETISLVVHTNPLLLRMFQTAVSEPTRVGSGVRTRGAIETMAGRLAEGPINDATYGSENAFLAEFTRAARAHFPGGELAPETRMLLALEPKARGGRFSKNMAILADDLYLSIGVPGNAADRFELGRLRARFGSMGVAPVDPATERRETPKDKRVKGGWLAALVPGALGSAMTAALEFVSARDLSILGFPSVTERWARSPELRSRLEVFHDRLVKLKEDFPSVPETSVWELALEVNGGRARDAAEMLGGVIGQTKRPLRYVERNMVPREPELVLAVPSFMKAARSYYLLGELHELGMRRFGRTALYPEGSGAEGPKFWHFYGAALVASRLGAKPAWAAKLTGAGIAAAYEAATCPPHIGLFGARGILRGVVTTLGDSRRDVVQHVRGHAFGRDLARGLTLAQEPAVPFSSWRAALERRRLQALEAFWKFWWEAGPPVVEQWNRYAARLSQTAVSGRRPSAREPRKLFIALRVLGLAVGLSDLPSLVASEASIKTEAKALFERHIDAGPGAREAFDRMLERASERYSGRSRNKIRSVAAFALRESSTLPSDALAAYYDTLATGDGVEPAQAKREQVLADFQRLGERAVAEANERALPGRRVLGLTIWGSYAYGAVRVGSDLDLQIVTEDGRPPDSFEWFERLEAEWKTLHPDVELEVYSNTWLPPDRKLLQGLMVEPYLIVSPYPEAHELLDDRRPKAGREAKVLKEPSPSRVLTGAARAFVKSWMRLLLGAPSEAETSIER